MSGVDPETLIGDRLVGVTIGWHVLGSERRPVLYFLCFASGFVEVRTEGSGAIGFWNEAPPSDFDMEQYGRFEFSDADARGPFGPLLGSPILGVDSIRWRGAEVGVRLVGDGALVAIANEGDEVFISAGDLPPDYDDATIV